MDYKELLKKAKEELPESTKVAERFEIPKVTGHIEGNKTVISNFFQITSALGREPEHVLKYILKELATPGEFKGNLLIIGTKMSAARINEKIKKYAFEYVLCRECGKPDTKITKEERINYMKCMACGAKHPIKGLI
jgi:translation initiation factor 2 subunit 2